MEKITRRVFAIENARADKDSAIELSFSSELPYERSWGTEILDHRPESVRLGRIASGHAPLLADHDTGNQIGVVKRAWVGSDKRGHALVRFSRSQRGREFEQDVLDGIRSNISVGYQIHNAVEEGERVFRVSDWEPLEISIVSIPADATVGVGRSINTKGQSKMENETNIVVNDRAGELKERDRVNNILSFCARNPKCLETGQRCIADGTSIEQFKQIVIEKHFNAKGHDQRPDIGMSPHEAGRYSFARAIFAASESHKDPRAWEKYAPFEYEVHQATGVKMRRDGREVRGFLVPFDVMHADIYGNVRDLAVGTPKSPGTGAGNLVATDLMSGSFIDILRARMLVRAMGAQSLGGLVGDVDIPKKTAGGAAYWVGESDDITAQSAMTFTQLSGRPKSVGTYQDFSRKTLLQTSLDVEAMVRNDLASTIAQEIDRVAIAGSGTGSEPRGILYTPGIGAVPSGGNPDWSDIVDLEGAIAAENADSGRLGYLTNTKVRALLKKTQKATNYPVYLWEDGIEAGFGMMNGYRAGASNNVPDDYIVSGGSSGSGASPLIFGNFADMFILEWGALDILIDPYTKGLQGAVRVRLFMDCDIIIRHAESFAAIMDISA